MDIENLLDPVRKIATEAGAVIMDVYRQPFEVDEKSDGSPVTLADRRAHDVIARGLADLTPDLPLLSEESAPGAAVGRRGWRRFWLVDPLDGTREFVNRNGEFTVNIALIEDGVAVLGVVHTPARGLTHAAARGAGAERSEAGRTAPVRCRPFNPRAVCLVASRSHAGAAVAAYRENLEREVGRVDSTSMGSALKIRLVAEGAADIYPRLGPTSEWDTAASHAVLTEAGGRLTDVHGRELEYNKESLLNPWFLAIGDPSHDWLRYLPPDAFADPG
ncbi:MAG: 3'(2'),5'-bisphosphate nucleotidase CysQ [Gammaproteobacteria bacterium]|nr:3'(2'),5'-bisphosphate nucleotidase CysQ [Gammaproteobacteria bacterium]